MKPDMPKEIIELCVFVPMFMLVAWGISDYRAYKRQLRENREWLDTYLHGKRKIDKTINKK